MPGEQPLAAWDFDLPEERIARRPAPSRSGSRLMGLPLSGGAPSHHRFTQLPTLLKPGDLLVANDAKVMAARLAARRASGGAVELLLLSPGPGAIPALARPARKLRRGEVLTLQGGDTAIITAEAQGGVVQLELSSDPVQVMAQQGSLPLPPYLDRPADDQDTDRYQTIFAGPLGAAAAPTAGLHFDQELLTALEAAGIGFVTITLQVGLGTFLPLRPEALEAGRLHTEPYTIEAGAVERIEATRAASGRVIAVGTTSARTLEAATPEGARVPSPGAGVTDLFVQPGYTFRCIDGLITNLHLPRSSLLMLVAALVGRRRLLDAYAEAIQADYRFYSYGDAMLLV
ncbi:MAG TPA: tRNA preQ1(34) S-adenosylmethionine ribosyltransferase-isomerase QueA [Deltaproteobacteria bacterium]|nr:tRNA preQ1(34) S-adenosylmethionine ribosyltransferase-isomerase QueA [Deltaproteobacteria bacterium]